MDLATAPADVLVDAGLIPHPDYADALRPGPLWLADIAAEAHRERCEHALRALGQLTREDVATILEAVSGK